MSTGTQREGLVLSFRKGRAERSTRRKVGKRAARELAELLERPSTSNLLRVVAAMRRLNVRMPEAREQLASLGYEMTGKPERAR
jgi:hypothetical protein